jgi:hypothetical protein
VRRLVVLACAALSALAPAAAAAPTIEEFAPVPTANAGLQDIVQGPDGNIWFTERNANMIGRISGTNPGATTEFPLAGGATSPDLTIRYTLSEAATVTLSFERVTRGRKVGTRCVKARRSNRRRRACTRFVAVKPALTFRDQAAGSRQIRFEGRLTRRRTLKPGRYRLTLRARDLAGNVSSPLRARVEILPRKRKRG